MEYNWSTIAHMSAAMLVFPPPLQPQVADDPSIRTGLDITCSRPRHHILRVRHKMRQIACEILAFPVLS